MTDFPRALGAHPRRLQRHGRGDRPRPRGSRLPHLRHPPGLPGRAPARRGRQGRHRGRGQRGALHQHERGRRREGARALAALAARFEERRAEGAHPYVRVVMHSLAFGSLVPFIADEPRNAVDRKKMEMTQDVMANSLVYWVQDLYRGGFLEAGSRIFSMTSEGSSRVVPSYGVVSSAKAALESHTRQLAMELARRGSGITANTIRAGVTMTPALMKIPEHDQIIEAAVRRNPTGRMTTPQDVAAAIVALSGGGTGFINGEIIGVDGGESITGS